jgi:hypothetical protein
MSEQQDFTGDFDIVSKPQFNSKGKFRLSGVVLSCPCHHLDEPCKPNCTCKNPLSSAGCIYCCTYGSKEQQKKMAEYLAEKLRT